MDQAAPLISVITAVYNGADYLPALIESVLAQGYPAVEHIIIDDGSTDDGATINVLKQYPHLRWWNRENQGQYATQNEALAAAHGDWIVVIAADDRFITPDVFRQVMDYAHLHPECEVIYGQTRYMDEAGNPMPRLEVSRPPSRRLLRHLVYVQHCAVFVRRDFIIKNQLGFDPTLRYAGDWDWLIRLFDAASHIGYLRQPLAVIRLHRSQTSRQSGWDRIHTEHRLVCQRYGGSYRLHLLFVRLVNLRGMGLIALDTLKTKGFAGLWRLGRNWAARRVFKQ